MPLFCLVTTSRQSDSKSLTISKKILHRSHLFKEKSAKATASHGIDFAQMMDGIVEGFMAQSIKTLFGWTLIAALFFAALILLWDIPMVRHQVKHIPSWSSVGLRVLRGVKRQQRLRKLRQERTCPIAQMTE